VITPPELAGSVCTFYLPNRRSLPSDGLANFYDDTGSVIATYDDGVCLPVNNSLSE